MQMNDSWTLRGVVSTALVKGNSCDLSNYITYVDLTKFAAWLNFILTL